MYWKGPGDLHKKRVLVTLRDLIYWWDSVDQMDSWTGWAWSSDPTSMILWFCWLIPASQHIFPLSFGPLFCPRISPSLNSVSFSRAGHCHHHLAVRSLHMSLPHLCNTTGDGIHWLLCWPRFCLWSLAHCGCSVTPIFCVRQRRKNKSSPKMLEKNVSCMARVQSLARHFQLTQKMEALLFNI